MVEVYPLGTFVAYVKLVDLAQIEIGIGLYALVNTMLLMIAIDAVLDADAIWEGMAHCVSAWKKDPHSGVIGVQTGPL